MRDLLRSIRICCFTLVLPGCADILPWPAFESTPAATSYTEQIPASEVAEQVRCELGQFVDHDATTSEPLLDPNGGAQVQLKLSTDLQGYVNYLGINLSGLGLGTLAALVSKSNNVPSLQLKAQGKSTVVSQIDFVIPQTAGRSVKGTKPGQTKPEDLLLKSLRLPKSYECRPKGLMANVRYYWFALWLDDALKRYKKRIYEGARTSVSFYDEVCQPKLTISTQFQLLFDVSAGANVLNALPVILPISGLNVDASPDYTHFLQIAFTLRQASPGDPNGQDKADACNAIQPKNAPPKA